MSDRPLRVAYFPDTFDEVDGVAHTSRHFEAYARRRGLPFLVVHGVDVVSASVPGVTERIALQRGPVGFPIDRNHRFDLMFCRYLREIEDRVRAFDADVVHITGPSDAGILGLTIAHRLSIPLAASWHTNLHMYAEQRSAGMLGFLSAGTRERMAGLIRSGSLEALQRFYRLAQVNFAPNQELCEMLERSTGKPCLPMYRGVDTHVFDPTRRSRSDDVFTIGFVGRLSPEKNVHDLAAVEERLLQAGIQKFRFVIVGQGPEEPWLRSRLRHAEFTGVLRGEALAEAFANMDVLVFPSLSDTFGNVVLEAMASGVPAVVMDSGGPRFLVKAGVTGFVARDPAEFCGYVERLATQPELRRSMARAAREEAKEASWDAVFDGVYAGYEHGLRVASGMGKRVRNRSLATEVVAGRLG